MNDIVTLRQAGLAIAIICTLLGASVSRASDSETELQRMFHVHGVVAQLLAIAKDRLRLAEAGMLPDNAAVQAQIAKLIASESDPKTLSRLLRVTMRFSSGDAGSAVIDDVFLFASEHCLARLVSIGGPASHHEIWLISQLERLDGGFSLSVHEALDKLKPN